MDIVSWILFGAIVGLVIHTIDSSEYKGSLTKSVMLGIFGGIGGGFVSYSWFGEKLPNIHAISFLLAMLCILLLLIVNKIYLKR